LAATGEQLLDRLDKQQEDFVEVDSLFVVPEDEIAAIECGQMIVRSEGVAFIAIPKHGSFYVETADVPLEEDVQTRPAICDFDERLPPRSICWCPMAFPPRHS
jgi:hypothetical protein